MENLENDEIQGSSPEQDLDTELTVETDTTDAGDTGETVATDDEPEKGPVPYERFAEVNERMKSAEQRIETLTQYVESMQPEAQAPEVDEADSLETELAEWEEVEPLTAFEAKGKADAIKRIQREIDQRDQQAARDQQVQARYLQALTEAHEVVDTIRETGTPVSEDEEKACLELAATYENVTATQAMRRAFLALKADGKIGTGTVSPQRKPAAEPGASLRPVVQARSRLVQTNATQPGARVVESGKSRREIAREVAAKYGNPTLGEILHQ